MTLNDFLKRVDIEKDRDKMIIVSDGRGWANCYIEKADNQIVIRTDCGSPFSDE